MQPSPDPTSTRQLWISFLLFMGPLVAGGGLLAILRTGERDWFYAAMMPVGIIMWCAGMVMRWRSDD